MSEVTSSWIHSGPAKTFSRSPIYGPGWASEIPDSGLIGSTPATGGIVAGPFGGPIICQDKGIIYIHR